MKIGPSFLQELKKANCRIDGLSWSNIDGQLTFNGVWSDGEIASVKAVFQAHDPTVLTDSDSRRKSFVEDLSRVNLIQRLKMSTPDQVKSYVSANVTDLESAKKILIAILLVLSTEVEE